MRLVTIPEVAPVLQVSRTVAYQLARNGELPGVVHLGPRIVRVDMDVLEEWIAREAGGAA